MMAGHGHRMREPSTYGDEFPTIGHHRGLGPLHMLDLTDEQRAEVGKIRDEQRKQHWALRDKLQDQYSTLRKLNAAETPDRAAIDKAYDEIFKTERQFVQVSVDATEKAEKLLTDDQKKVFTRWRRAGPGPCVTSDR